MQPGKGFKTSVGEARNDIHYTMKGVTRNILDLKIGGADTGQAFALFEQTGSTPNGGPPLHIHPYQDEWFHVLEGKYLFQVGPDRYEVAPGDTLFLPRNVPHAFIQLSEHARTLVGYSPAGKMQEFFAATDQWETPPSKEEVVRVFDEHEMKVVGPPLKLP